MGQGENASGRHFPVVVNIAPNEDVLPGMAAEVVLGLTVDAGVRVPPTAVIRDGRPLVMAVRDGVITRVPVEVEALFGDDVQVRGALEAGELVVVGAHARLVEGDRVHVVEAESGDRVEDADGVEAAGVHEDEDEHVNAREQVSP